MVMQLKRDFTEDEIFLKKTTGYSKFHESFLVPYSVFCGQLYVYLIYRVCMIIGFLKIETDTV